jgi:hypothetical protein
MFSFNEFHGSKQDKEDKTRLYFEESPLTCEGQELDRKESESKGETTEETSNTKAFSNIL